MQGLESLRFGIQFRHHEPQNSVSGWLRIYYIWYTAFPRYTRKSVQVSLGALNVDLYPLASCLCFGWKFPPLFGFHTSFFFLDSTPYPPDWWKQIKMKKNIWRVESLTAAALSTRWYGGGAQLSHTQSVSQSQEFDSAPNPVFLPLPSVSCFTKRWVIQTLWKWPCSRHIVECFVDVGLLVRPVRDLGVFTCLPLPFP